MELKLHNRITFKSINTVSLLILLILGYATTLEAQNSNRINPTLGFSCSFVGKPTAVVIKISELIENSHYDSIKDLLHTGNAAEKYLAVLLCEKLMQEKKIALTISEKKTIRALYQSKETVTICSGCTYFKKTTLHALLTRESYFAEI
ncbi:hypothetical protein FF125_07850 [Aureibaculum algae]|uniref:Uncharacterized protein n=1 Tax=Aureibaculum algae TaxID=2584122 RepID=A0A5B7TQ53_9FLAO|nr:hypothetical protein [Aureibaculum algae]QCX38348.1 hypothetical protein FF125_07850 [Aureibaculum algae]